MPVVFMFWLVTLLAAVGGGFLLLRALTAAESAAQQAALAALAVAIVAVPYVFTRAFEGMVLIALRPPSRRP